MSSKGRETHHTAPAARQVSQAPQRSKPREPKHQNVLEQLAACNGSHPHLNDALCLEDLAWARAKAKNKSVINLEKLARREKKKVRD